ncbi:MAG: class I SAM-dependent methyltransferase [Bacteroidales bacterium]|nr:class I SAM-dependent methyltransferase [Bacteroidales bacterium]
MTNYLHSSFDLNSEKQVDLIDELPVWSAPFGLKLLEHIKLKKNITALDIGFGAGFPLTELAMRLGNSSRVLGIDPWGAGIKRTKKKLQFYGIKNVKLIQGWAEKIPLKDHSVDLITSNNGINNVADLNTVLSECFRVMKSGGQFIQTVNLDTSFIEFYDIMEAVLKDLKMEPEIGKMKHHIYEKRKPLKEFTEVIKQHNFSVVNILHDQFNYTFADGTTMLNHYFIRLAFLLSWKNIIPEERQTEVFKSIEEIMNQQAAKDGVFKLSVPFVVIDCEKK